MPKHDAGKIAFVTGGSSGIGRSTAVAFVDAGFAVVLADRDGERGELVAAELAGRGQVAFVECDVADDAAVERAVGFTLDRFGRLDAAFNCAGIDGGTGVLLADQALETVRKVMAVNVIGLWSCMRYQIAAMLEGGGGSIVNCSSAAGLVGVPFMSAYSASKHAVVGFTKTAAVEYARQGIRVNAVCPAMVDTAMIRSALSDSEVAALNEISPVGRIGRPSEIAATVVWLCGEDAPYLTGQAIAVDGGWTAR